MKLLSIVLGFWLYTLSLPINAEVVLDGCTNQQITLSKNFESARFNSCLVLDNNVFELSLVPENEPINPSPWYAFKVHAKSPSTVTIVLNYTKGKHRYWPKVSDDFVSWQRLSEQQVELSQDAKQVRLQLDVKQGDTWIAAQPLINNSAYQLWLEQMTVQQPAVSLSEVGKTVQGRSLLALTSTAKNKKPLIVLLGRQHPPEVTGALAMFTFVETLMQDTELAQKFRQEINLLVVPNINPDGVAAGNWRHNVNGIDLNRDWGPFSQPETRQTNEYIRQYMADKSLWLVIDFHSTWRDIFYIQPAEQETRFPHLVDSWMAAINQADSPIIFEPKPGHAPDKPTSKSYFYEKYKVPTLTYELGDDSKPSDIEDSSKIAAKTLMELLLSEVSL
ncbi:M14 family metallopeptidase [Paraglaciecola sp. 25GB23A]|uniref:M14 family metallopeptidase n=1 Tax=Paraglaciecola sp. 25GB23A TaxID=3156068 RepID=UPI0032AF6E7E